MPEIIIQRPVEQEMYSSFIDYAMSVIVSRALADARDGFKPVHRRILYDMHELGLTPEKPFKKSARIVGDVLGKYHPHGDQSVYDAAVIMAQDFATRYPLVWGHGNWGSIDGDSAAAMRYTEAKMTRYGQAMLSDINKNTIDFVPNFDGTEQEPSVVPTLIPNLLANGTFGIAVGMTSNIAPHNLRELYDAINFIIDCNLEGKEANIDEIMQYVKGPDFPTGGQIIGLDGIKQAYKTGRGKITVRAKYEIEETKNGSFIVVTELPYQVNKAKLVENIYDLIKNGQLEGARSVRDESDKDGMRMIVELKRDANPQLVLNNLFKKTKMQDNFGYISLAIVEGQPKVLNIQEALEIFLQHAAEVIVRRTQYDLDKASIRLNIVEGILRCAENEELLQQVIETVRHEEDPVKALQDNLGFNEAQAEYIFDMKIRALSSASSKKLSEEREQLTGDIAKFNEILEDDSVLLNTMKTEFTALRNKFGDDRRTEIVLGEGNSIEEEDLIKEEMLVVSITSDGLIKSVEEKEYKTQGRGGKGVKVANTKDDEIVKYMLTVGSKDDILFFTNHGRCHTLKAYKIAKTSRTARGKSIANYLSFAENETVVSVLSTDLKDKNKDILFVTVYGIIKRLPLEQLSSRLSITRVIGFKEGDALQSAIIVEPEDNVLITTALGQGIRIAMNAEGSGQIRPMGRAAAGVIGINLSENDYVVDIAVIASDSTLLTVTENGLGKRTSVDQWPVQNRGGKGVITHKVTEKTGIVVAATTVVDSDELFVSTEQGLITRINVSDISVFGRSTAGVKIMNLNEGDKIGSISKGNSEE